MIYDPSFILDVWKGTGLRKESNYRWVDLDEYDIKPKKDYVKRQIAEKEEEIKRLEAAKSKSISYYDEARERIEKEIGDLKKQT